MRAFPEGATFAFTIVDDTDDATVENVKPIYDLLRDLGFRTTKTVWPVACPEGSDWFFAGKTLDDRDYRSFVLDLARTGFEIAFHCATMESSLRFRTEAAFERYRELFGGYPRLHCNHAHNRENLYWGLERYQFLPTRLLVIRESAWGRRTSTEGHVPESPYFWGDLALKHLDYVRNFAFQRLDVSRIYPGRAYSLTSTPFVKRWFNSADAPDVLAFKGLVTRESVDDLVRSGGYCILSTHLGKGFVKEGIVDPEVRDRLDYIASKKGWFVPASELLDFLGTVKVNPYRMAIVEAKHMIDRLLQRRKNSWS